MIRGRWKQPTRSVTVECTTLGSANNFSRKRNLLYALTLCETDRMKWLQKTVQLTPRRRGFHLVTKEVLDALPELAGLKIGLLQVFIQHTSASLTINENADPDVPKDLESSFSSLAPEDFPYQHTCEGPDDMPAHVKASMLGSSLTIPIRDGNLLLGTWQGIYLCEHRNHGSHRDLVLTVCGSP